MPDRTHGRFVLVGCGAAKAPELVEVCKDDHHLIFLKTP
jgi:hypothetical protein